MHRLTFVNLPVADIAASQRFFRSLGFDFDPKFTDDTAACLIINEGTTYAMLLERSRFADFVARPLGDPAQSTSAIIAVSADDRETVDAFADAALDAGGTPAKEPLDHGFMYGRSFYDLDGHHWEVMWMSQEAVEAGPEDFAQMTG